MPKLKVKVCRNCGWELEWCERCEEYYCADCDGGHSGCEYGDDDEYGDYGDDQLDEDYIVYAQHR